MDLAKFVKAGVSRAIALCGVPFAPKMLARAIYFVIQSLARRRPAKESLALLLELERHLFILTGAEACRYGDGIHTKHRHTGYHQFFVERMRPGEIVIDIGCGNGALSYDLAQAGARVVGIDMNDDYIAVARQRYAHSNLALVKGDVLKDLPNRTFDTVVMSNVLEHLEHRVAFLRDVQAALKPKRWLLRVPLYERDWRVPLMEEVGVDYRLDDTHYVEYTKEQFVDELRVAGLRVTFEDIRWGEIWCEAAAPVRQ